MDFSERSLCFYLSAVSPADRVKDTDHDCVPIRVIVQWLFGIPRLTPVSTRAGDDWNGAGLSRQSVVFVCFYI